MTRDELKDRQNCTMQYGNVYRRKSSSENIIVSRRKINIFLEFNQINIFLRVPGISPRCVAFDKQKVTDMFCSSSRWEIDGRFKKI